MKKTAVIVVDIGTSSLRAVLFDAEGGIRHLSRRECVPAFLSGGRVEQDPATWSALVPDAVRECAAAAAAAGLYVEALSLTAQRSSVIPVDADFVPLRPAIMWQDTRTEGICERLRPEEPAICERTGLRVTPVFSAVKMTWMKENEPKIYAAARSLVGIQDFVLHELTGARTTDRSLASRTNLYNLRTGDWDPDMLALFGVDRELLCGLIDPGAVAGTLTAAAAAKLDLEEGLPVVSAGGDQQCAALGLGLLAPGDVVANTGTGSYIVAASTEAATDPEMRVFCNVAAVPGTFILEAGTPTTGTVYRWFSETFYDAKKTFAELDEEALASPPGANGVVLMPHFKGAGAPYWNPAARGFFYNLSLGTTRSDMARAVLEGIATEMAGGLDLVERFAGPARTVRAAGGLAKSELFNQMQADAYGKTVVRTAESEATAVGAWISAAAAIGLYPDYAAAYRRSASRAEERAFEPDPERTALYRALMRSKEALYFALQAAALSAPRMP